MARNLYRFYFYTVFITIRSMTAYWLVKSLAMKLLSPFAALRARGHQKHKQAGSAKKLLCKMQQSCIISLSIIPLMRDRALSGYL
jgi:hypothetical protein